MSGAVGQPLSGEETGQRIAFPCPLCGRTDLKVLYPDTLGQEMPRFGYDFTPEHTRTYRVVLCRPCRHAFCSPRPARLWAEYAEVEDPAYLERQEDRIATAGQVLSRLQRFAPSGRLLDIGCATGDFLAVARENYQVEGLELSAWAAAIARRRGLTLHETDLAGFHPNAPFDLLTLWGVIEHFEDPAREVRTMSRLVRPGGLVCLWTGDREAWLARLLERRWWYIQGQHLQVFSRASLEKVFRDAGFETLWVGRYPCVMTMRSIAKSLRRYPLLGSATARLLGSGPLASRSVTLTLPGEMFAVFRRKTSS